MNKRALGAAILAVLGATGSAAQAPPFSGTWVLDSSRTVLYGSSAAREFELEVVDDRASVRVAERRGRGQTHYVCTTDGRPSAQTTAAGDVYVRTVRREKTALLWQIKMTRGADHASIDYTERWSVSHDGRTLTVHRVYPGSRESVLVFARKGPVPQV